MEKGVYMYIRDILRDIIDEEGTSAYRLSKDMGHTVNAVRNKMNRSGSNSVNGLIELCDMLGADVVIKHYGTEYVVDRDK